MHWLRCLLFGPYGHKNIFMLILSTQTIGLSSCFVQLALKQIEAFLPVRVRHICDPLSHRATEQSYGGAGTNTHTHTHAHKCMRINSNIWYTQYMHTQADTITHYKSDSCRYDGALGEGEVKA